MLGKTNNETVEAEITVIMLLQRARVAESRVKNRLSNGPLRAQSKAYFTPSILRRVGIRQLPGICRYPAKRTAVVAVNQGGTADKVYLFVLDRFYHSVKGVFCYGDEENGHRACTNGHLTTANQSEIRKAYLVSESSFGRSQRSFLFYLRRCCYELSTQL